MKSPFWYCNVCNAQNHEEDGECQFCECQGKDCKRDNCSDPRHFENDDNQAFYDSEHDTEYPADYNLAMAGE